MNRTPSLASIVLLLAVSIAGQNSSPPADPAWKIVEQGMGRPGQLQPDGAYKFSMPRKDLNVLVNGVQIKPALALGSWAAFSSPGEHAAVMGDLVLTEDEVPPVMRKLQAGGIEITALHNHLLHESPRVMYMHIHGTGDAPGLARAIHNALGETGTPAPDNGAPAPRPPGLGIDQGQIEQALGAQGKVNGGVLQFGVARADHVSEGSMTIPNSMGLSTALNFQPTGGGKAAITGDFVLIASEVNPVIKALTRNGISVTAVHSHMLGEQPRLFFMHFWANDDAVTLAKGLRAALDQTNAKK
jgi:hypothetical protein